MVRQNGCQNDVGYSFQGDNNTGMCGDDGGGSIIGLLKFVVSGREWLTMANNVTTLNKTIFNDDGFDIDFHIESDTNANAFYVDGTTSNIGVGTSIPRTTLDVVGNVTVSGYINVTGGDSYNATIYLNQSRIWDNGSHICMGAINC